MLIAVMISFMVTLAEVKSDKSNENLLANGTYSTDRGKNDENIQPYIENQTQSTFNHSNTRTKNYTVAATAVTFLSTNQEINNNNFTGTEDPGSVNLVIPNKEGNNISKSSDNKLESSDENTITNLVDLQKIPSKVELKKNEHEKIEDILIDLSSLFKNHSSNETTEIEDSVGLQIDTERNLRKFSPRFSDESKFTEYDFHESKFRPSIKGIKKRNNIRKPNIALQKSLYHENFINDDMRYDVNNQNSNSRALFTDEITVDSWNKPKHYRLNRTLPFYYPASTTTVFTTVKTNIVTRNTNSLSYKSKKYKKLIKYALDLSTTTDQIETKNDRRTIIQNKENLDDNSTNYVTNANEIRHETPPRNLSTTNIKSYTRKPLPYFDRNDIDITKKIYELLNLIPKKYSNDDKDNNNKLPSYSSQMRKRSKKPNRVLLKDYNVDHDESTIPNAENSINDIKNESNKAIEHQLPFYSEQMRTTSKKPNRVLLKVYNVDNDTSTISNAENSINDIKNETNKAIEHQLPFYSEQMRTTSKKPNRVQLKVNNVDHDESTIPNAEYSVNDIENETNKAIEHQLPFYSEQMSTTSKKSNRVLLKVFNKDNDESTVTNAENSTNDIKNESNKAIIHDLPFYSAQMRPTSKKPNKVLQNLYNVDVKNSTNKIAKNSNDNNNNTAESNKAAITHGLPFYTTQWRNLETIVTPLPDIIQNITSPKPLHPIVPPPGGVYPFHYNPLNPNTSYEGPWPQLQTPGYWMPVTNATAPPTCPPTPKPLPPTWSDQLRHIVHKIRDVYFETRNRIRVGLGRKVKGPWFQPSALWGDKDYVVVTKPETTPTTITTTKEATTTTKKKKS